MDSPFCQGILSNTQKNLDMEQYSSPTTVYFDRSGDRRLLVDSQDGAKALVVSSKIMSLVSDHWKAMLGPDGKFIEAHVGHSGDILLPDDDLKALSILLHIAHLQFDKVPQVLEFEELLAVAVLTDKYQATHMVTPWLASWIKDLEHLADEDGYEEWLWIAWEFGRIDLFEHIANRLVLESRTNEDKQCLSASGVVLGRYMPLNITESILDVRNATIQRLIDAVYQYVDRFPCDTDAEPLCKATTDKEECDALVFGSLAIGLRRLKLWPDRNNSSKIVMNVNELAAELRKLEIFAYPQGISYGHQSSHYGCSFTEELKDSILDILDDIPDPLMDSHRRHLGVQKGNGSLATMKTW